LSRNPSVRPRRGKSGTVQIEIVVRSARWRRQPRAERVLRTAVRAAAAATSTGPAELAIVLSHDSAVQALNREWRGKDAPTNVLSFPASRVGEIGPPSPYLGDIVIAYETTAREAASEGKLFHHHLAHLAVHGFLHLVGYDHENNRDADRMERLERRILARLAVPDPYAVRDAEA